MSETGLREVLTAEKAAQERVREAQTQAEKIRADAAAEAEKIEKESAERVEKMRAERHEASEQAIVEAHKKTAAETEALLSEWRARYDARADELIEKTCRILRGDE